MIEPQKSLGQSLADVLNDEYRVKQISKILDEIWGPVLSMAEIRRMEKVREEIRKEAREMGRNGREKVLEVRLTVVGDPPPGMTIDEWEEKLTERAEDGIRTALNGTVEKVEIGEWSSVG